MENKEYDSIIYISGKSGCGKSSLPLKLITKLTRERNKLKRKISTLKKTTVNKK